MQEKKQELITQQQAYISMDKEDDQQILMASAGRIVFADKVEKAFFYQFPTKSGKVEGLSKVGIDECANQLQKENIFFQETDFTYEVDPTDHEYVLFSAKCVSFSYFPTGEKFIIGEAIGTKRQWRFQEVNVFCQETKTKIKKKEEDPFWFEKGQQKASRNAKSDLIPYRIKAKVLEGAKELVRQLKNGKVLKNYLIEETRKNYENWKNEFFTYERQVVDSEGNLTDMKTSDLRWCEIADSELRFKDTKTESLKKIRSMLHVLQGLLKNQPEYVNRECQQIQSQVRALIVMEKRENDLKRKESNGVPKSS
jgi:hypothetical protein